MKPAQTTAKIPPPPIRRRCSQTVLTKCGVATSNLFLGGFYSHKFADNFRFSVFFGTTIPVGERVQRRNWCGLAEAPTGHLARSAMDNVMFAVNDWAMVEGLDRVHRAPADGAS